MDLAAVALCGVLHIVGSEGSTSLVLETGLGKRVELVGAPVDALRSSWTHICIEGERTSNVTIGAQYVVRVIHVRPAGDGRHAPIVGVIRETARGLRIWTEDGKSFALATPVGDDLRRLLGERVWLLGYWNAGRIVVTTAGLF